MECIDYVNAASAQLTHSDNTHRSGGAISGENLFSQFAKSGGIFGHMDTRIAERFHLL